MRKFKDILLQAITYLFSSVGIITVIAIFVFVFRKGYKSLSWDLLISDYHISSYTLSSKPLDSNLFENTGNYENFSTRWGVAFEDSLDIEGKSVVKVLYVHPSSPLLELNNQSDNSIYSISEGQYIETAILSNEEGYAVYCYSKEGASKMAINFDSGNEISTMTVSTKGGGIRGSLITTLYLILLTLLFALPIGIGGAIYLGVYAPKNKFTDLLRTMIDMISGIPSIIFGLVGAMIFIPIFNVVAHSSGGSILSGAATMAVLLLPTIIKTTEEAIRNIPSSYKSASLALGASETQTTFKIILPNAISGILTATILSIGRVIGESAALIFAIGTSIQDSITINGQSTSLAVHIWYLMGGENPNYGTSCAIAIVILCIVLFLNIIVKIIGHKLNRFEVK